MHCKARYFGVALASLLFASFTLAQQPAARAPKPRKLAPGVLTVIPVEREESDVSSGPRPILEVTEGIDARILNWKPEFYPESDTLKSKASQVVFRRNVWYLEFAFKPLRMIEIDMPQPSGKMQKKNIWYMAYRVKNNGYHLAPTKGTFVVEDPKAEPKWTADADEFGHFTFGANRVNHTVRFIPTFVLESHEFSKRYMDQLIPLAIPKIQQREDPAIKLYDSVSISSIDIPVSDERVDRSVWGVVTWMDVDPQIDFFSIYIQGLTNAYHFEETPGAFKLGSAPLTGRKLTSKTLQLCFWRPGDAVYEHEGEIRYGMPVSNSEKETTRLNTLYGVPARTEFRWIFQ